MSSSYELLEIIGTGTYGKVYKARRKRDGVLVAIKTVPLDGLSDTEKVEALNESRVLSQTDHVNIIKHLESFIHDNALYIVAEYCDGGDLSKRIRACGTKHMDEEQIYSYFIQICQGLKYLHERRIIHRDLKPPNIFMDQNGTVKIGDLGLVRVLGPQSAVARTGVGTPLYMSPEVCQENAYNEKCDIWGLGCVVFEMATLRPPFTASNQLALAKKIVSEQASPLPRHFSVELQFLVSRMLSKDPAQRPHVEQILSYPSLRLRLERQQAAEREDKLRGELQAIHRTLSTPVPDPHLQTMGGAEDSVGQVRQLKEHCDQLRSQLAAANQRHLEELDRVRRAAANEHRIKDQQIAGLRSQLHAERRRMEARSSADECPPRLQTLASVPPTAVHCAVQTDEMWIDTARLVVPVASNGPTLPPPLSLATVHERLAAFPPDSARRMSKVTVTSSKVACPGSESGSSLRSAATTTSSSASSTSEPSARRPVPSTPPFHPDHHHHASVAPHLSAVSPVKPLDTNTSLPPTPARRTTSRRARVRRQHRAPSSALATRDTHRLWPDRRSDSDSDGGGSNADESGDEGERDSPEPAARPVVLGAVASAQSPAWRAPAVLANHPQPLPLDLLRSPSRPQLQLAAGRAEYIAHQSLLHDHCSPNHPSPTWPLDAEQLRALLDRAAGVRGAPDIAAPDSSPSTPSRATDPPNPSAPRSRHPDGTTSPSALHAAASDAPSLADSPAPSTPRAPYMGRGPPNPPASHAPSPIVKQAWAASPARDPMLSPPRAIHVTSSDVTPRGADATVVLFTPPRSSSAGTRPNSNAPTPSSTRPPSSLMTSPSGASAPGSTPDAQWSDPQSRHQWHSNLAASVLAQTYALQQHLHETTRNLHARRTVAPSPPSGAPHPTAYPSTARSPVHTDMASLTALASPLKPSPLKLLNSKYQLRMAAAAALTPAAP